MSIHQDQARQPIQQLIILYNTLSAEEKKELTEASVVRQLVDPLLLT